jgi:inorganic pyrophosphatase
VGDGDPLDICVFSERIIPHGDIVVHAKPIGGLRMIDNGEADDKIIAVLHKDLIFGKWNDITDCPKAEVDRLKHYFLTYKQDPDNPGVKCEITHVYGREEAMDVVRRAHEDYLEMF